MWPSFVSAGQTHPSPGFPVPFQRLSRTMRTRGLSGRTRRAAFVFPLAISSTPFRPPSQVMFSHLRQWHSSGRIPVSNRTTETPCSNGKAAARYRASSLGVTTRSRRYSPLRNLTFGEASSTPHSTARRRTRRKARRQLFTELICNPSRCRSDAYSATSSGPISFTFKFARVLDFLIESIPNPYHSQVLEDAFSKVDFAQGSTRSIQKALRVGTTFLSLMPTCNDSAGTKGADLRAGKARHQHDAGHHGYRASQPCPYRIHDSYGSEG